MHKRTPKYWLVALLTLAAAYAGNRVALIAPTSKVSAQLNQLPKQLGTWHGTDVKLDDATMKALNADQVLCRQYTDKVTERSAGLLVVYRKYGRRDFAHRPELCYPASGWEIVGKSYTNVPYAGRNVKARLVIAEQDLSREAITYWFASGNRTEGNFAKQQLWMALDRLQKQRHGWAFIRVNVPEMYGDEDALELTRSFMKAAEGPMMKALSGE